MNKILIIISILLFSLFLNAQENTSYNRTVILQFYQNQDFEKAVSHLLTIQKEEMPLSYNLDLGYSYYMIDDVPKSQTAYLKAFQKDTGNIQANLYLATIYNRQKLPEMALSHYKRLTILYPENYKYWQYAATILESLKEIDTAHAYIQKSYALRPQSSSVAYQFAELLQKKKMYGDAEKVVDEFIRKDSSNELILSKKVDISFNSSKHDEVIFWGERLWQNNAQTSGAFTKLMFSYLNKNKPDKCIQLFNWMESGNMTNESVQYGAALAYAKKKDFIKSNELLDKCIKNNILIEAAIYLRAKGDNYENLKQFDKAIAHYDTSYYIFQMPQDLFHAGSVYDRNLKNKSKATTYYKQYMKRAGKPLNNSEIQIANYIKEFLKPDDKK